MKTNSKISSAVKLKVVKKYLEGSICVTETAQRLGVHRNTIARWVYKYKVFGASGLKLTKRNGYSSEFKLEAVTYYINGRGSLNEVCELYKIPSISILMRWIASYNSHKVLKSRGIKGDKVMTKGRSTTYEERVEIVSFCIANNNDIKLTANKYNVSYPQLYSWIKKYNNGGYEALVDRRGKNKSVEELSEGDKIAAKIKLLEAENRRLQMENDFLKKLEEIKRRSIK